MDKSDAVAGAGDTGSADVLRRLPDAQVFARDAEDYDAESLKDVMERLAKVVARKRKARQDDALVAEQAAKMKKANAAAKKKKPAGKLAADPMETVL